MCTSTASKPARSKAAAISTPTQNEAALLYCDGTSWTEVDTGPGEDHVFVVDVGVPDDLGDVAALDVPVRVCVRGHLPLQVSLDPGYAGNQALVADIARAERTLGQSLAILERELGATDLELLETRTSYETIRRQLGTVPAATP